MRRAIEYKQKEIDQIQNKMVLPQDTDILRMKIQKDIESRHKIDLDQRSLEIERVTEHLYETTRKYEIVKT